MTDAPATLIRATLPAIDPPLGARLVTFIRNLPQRCGEREFWITQAAVIAVTSVHVIAEAWALEGGRDIPAAFHHIPVVLYLVPIAYASLRFGSEGAVLTGLWSALLTLPNLLIWHREEFEWMEFLYVAVVIVVGTVMSLPVERERQQRQRAEATIQRLALLDDIATLTLTGDLTTTLDETLRRLVDELDLEAACVAVADGEAAGHQPRVLGCQPSAAGAGDELVSCLQTQPLPGPSRCYAPGEGVLVVPLTADLPGAGPDGRVDGLLAAKVGTATALTDDDHRLLAGVASHIAVAIANERLTQAERLRLRSYARLITQAQEEERKRIARELHDEASQNLVVIRRGLDSLATTLAGHGAAGDLVELRDLAGQTVAGIRRFSRDLRPPTLDELGLSSALDQLVTQVRERGLPAAEFRVRGPYERLPIETELAVFRIGQAALHNVERHAQADEVTVALTFESSRIVLEVSDDGCGFDPPPTLGAFVAAGKLGLVGMHERAQLIGGSLQIRSQPGAGTSVVLAVPG